MSLSSLQDRMEQRAAQMAQMAKRDSDDLVQPPSQ